VADRAAGYNIPGRTVEGNDLITVYEAAHDAIAHARSGRGPILLECLTYRWRQHCELDERFIYRNEREVEEWKKKCPIARFKQRLLDQGIFTEETAEAIDVRVQDEMDAAVEFARQSPFPELREALDDIYLGRNTAGEAI
jgi:pyruvate dehydrogenase E1 component alpha subunit